MADMQKAGNTRVGEDHEEFVFVLVGASFAQLCLSPFLLPFLLDLKPIESHVWVILRWFLKIMGKDLKRALLQVFLVLGVLEIKTFEMLHGR